MSRLLLLSGGLDSTCVAAWQRPEQCLGVDYGQRAAEAEHRAATAVAQDLGLPYTHITVDASAVGGGVMARQPVIVGTTPEWWPFRNQFLITVSAGWAIAQGLEQILVGTVAGDGDRHADGRQAFYDAMNVLFRSQEGSISVSVPAIQLSTTALMQESKVTDQTLGWTHSCHVGNLPCGRCPGCLKRAEVLAQAGRLR